MLDSIAGKEVLHNKFGGGRIISIRDGILSIQFQDKQRRFIYPEAFGKFLTTPDTELEEQVQLDFKLKQDESSRKILQTVNSGTNASKEEKRNAKKDERSNVAFKCNYCDGGMQQGTVGFNGVCSDSTIRYNIEKAHHIWCSDVDCPCKQYIDGKISRTELCDALTNGVLVCYESTMLKDWKASAGRIQNGENRNRPMKISKVQTNSLAILTTKKPDSPDNERFIFAVFLVDEKFEGDTKDEGYVIANSKWKIELSPQEASKMLFWNYYANENAPEKVLLGSGLHRYISDSQAVQILRDIIAIKTEQSEKEFAQAFLKHFCAVNGIDENDVPLPNGALLRKDG